MEIPAVAAWLLGPGLPAAGWYARKVIERRWQHADRSLGVVKANLTEQHKLLA
jgi:hypothetical protein